MPCRRTQGATRVLHTGDRGTVTILAEVDQAEEVSTPA